MQTIHVHQGVDTLKIRSLTAKIRNEILIQKYAEFPATLRFTACFEPNVPDCGTFQISHFNEPARLALHLWKDSHV
ncbi:MAG: hypothetical protein ACRCXD_04680 [Luteolibacter sp.]